MIEDGQDRKNGQALDGDPHEMGVGPKTDEETPGGGVGHGDASADAQTDLQASDGGDTPSAHRDGPMGDRRTSKIGSSDDGVEIDLGLDDDRHSSAEGESSSVGEEPAIQQPVDLVGTLEQRIEEMSGELERTKNQLLRVAADFENYRKRMQRQILDVENRAAEKVLVEILPVMDSLALALEHVEGSGDGASLAEGVGLVVKQFSSILAKLGVEPIEALGRPFDPAIHEAMQQEESSDVAPGTVIKEWQRGYRIGDRLLRPSMVVVSSAPAGAPEIVESSEESAAATENSLADGRGADIETSEDNSEKCDGAQEDESTGGDVSGSELSGDVEDGGETSVRHPQ